MVLIFSEQKQAAAPIPCVICREQHTLGELIAGSLYADGSQAVACSAHLPHNTRDWMLAWVVFETTERRTPALEAA
jgi:hypothetical protein